MSTQTDTFARFVDLLAVTLDDHETSAEALASHVHLSRSHFDRLVTAAAGEAPATLRRRILLERAAFRLATTDQDILGIALDAGYSSHEAFTRAFARAYDQPPSHWRRRPAPFRIAAPNDLHFHPPGSLRLPPPGKAITMDLLTRIFDHHVWLVGEMLDRAERLPADVLDAPITISVDGVDCDPTLRSLLSRLVGQLAMWDAVTHDRPYDFDVEVDESVGSMQRRLAQAGPAFLAQVEAIVAEDRLDETFVDATCDPPRVFTYGGMLAHVLTFAAHRRTIVCGALADSGIPDLGAGDPMRWVAEHA